MPHSRRSSYLCTSRTAAGHRRGRSGRSHSPRNSCSSKQRKVPRTSPASSTASRLHSRCCCLDGAGQGPSCGSECRCSRQRDMRQDLERPAAGGSRADSRSYPGPGSPAHYARAIPRPNRSMHTMVRQDRRLLLLLPLLLLPQHLAPFPPGAAHSRRTALPCYRGSSRGHATPSSRRDAPVARARPRQRTTPPRQHACVTPEELSSR